MIPKNHPIYPFPYNLEDRIKFIIESLSNKINENLTKQFIIKKLKDINNNLRYEMSIKNNMLFKDIIEDFKNFNFKLDNDIWILLVE